MDTDLPLRRSEASHVFSSFGDVLSRGASLISGLQVGCLDVWIVTLGGDMRCFRGYLDCLSAEELARAARLLSEGAWMRFTASHTILRIILASYLHTTPADILFASDERGKPCLGAPYQESGIQFNLSHSSAVALIGVASGCWVGVDIERIRPVPHRGAVAMRFFSAGEHALYTRAPEEEKQRLFFTFWTRKEALAKALGLGLCLPLRTVDVSGFTEHGVWCYPALSGGITAKTWSIRDIDAGLGFSAAYAVEEPAGEERVFRVLKEGPADS